jgi:hypothetical protein
MKIKVSVKTGFEDTKQIKLMGIGDHLDVRKRR